MTANLKPVKSTILVAMGSTQILAPSLYPSTLVSMYSHLLAGKHSKTKRQRPEEWSEFSLGKSLTDKTYSAYRNTPRRISGSYAVTCLLPIPMMSCFSTNAPSPDRNITNFSGERWRHFNEAEDTLYIYSWEIGKNTWISTPERAMIETAFMSYDYRYPEWLLRVLLTYEMNSALLFDASEALGMNNGFRRLAAISTLYPYVSRKKTPIWISELQEYAEHIDEPNILLCEGIPTFSEKDSDICEDFGVIWNFDKQEIINEIYT